MSENHVAMQRTTRYYLTALLEWKQSREVVLFHVPGMFGWSFVEDGNILGLEGVYVLKEKSKLQISGLDSDF